ncbi:YraN family protein [[Limnothrix rosea] IAM M-220]|uniref:YraN family protein n=1 Tax=[Limnothrix rosea] IAM M-220 TaxID=454133 RepID=UPI0009638C03|nr:YraN family protein [[Limnothrix rosea] IAM M-220]OKH19955.1 YraN family protein [[Limnothrix rosea] IAM M-220]
MSQSKPKTTHKIIGDRGEKFICDYLAQNQWEIIVTQWHCRYGELDIVAFQPSQKIVAFVEVKTRRSQGLDAQGLFAITSAKQRKTIKAALQFLAESPQYEKYGCRFDVALVSYCGNSSDTYQCKLEQYLDAAFEATDFFD